MYPDWPNHVAWKPGIPAGSEAGGGMPGPTVEAQVAVFAAAGGAYVTSASSVATTSATTFTTDSSRIRHAPLHSPLRERDYGTWMAANVFFTIIPGQRALVAA